MEQPREQKRHSRTDRPHDRILGGELSLHDVYLMQERIEARLDAEAERGRRIEAKLGRIIQLERKELRMDEQFKVALDKVTEATKRDTDVTQSAVTAINGLNQTVGELKSQVEQAGSLDEAIALVTDAASAIDANTSALSAAIRAGTPAEGGDQPL